MKSSLIVNTMQNNDTKFAVFFAFLGVMMIFLIPMITEKVDARTVGLAQGFYLGLGPAFTNLKWNLEAGKWIETPSLGADGRIISWTTAGSGIFGGLERGTVEADFGPGRHVIFKWTNPDRGENHCVLGWTGPVYTLPCRISQGPGTAHAYYVVSSIPLP